MSTLYIVFAISENAEIDSDYLATYYDTNLWHRGIREIAILTKSYLLSSVRSYLEPYRREPEEEGV